MKKRGVCLLVVLLLSVLVLPTVIGASQSDLVKLEAEFDGEDFKCEAIYKEAPSNTPSPLWFWYGPEGAMDGENDNLLPREKFRRGQNIRCKYLDPANDQNLELNTIIPNAAPILERIEDKELKKGKILTINPIVNDPDGDEVEFVYSSPFDGDGTWDNNVQYDVGTYTVTITAIDPFGATDEISFDVELVDQLVVDRQDYNLQFQNKQNQAQEVKDLDSSRYSKKFTLVKKDTELELYPDIDPQASLVPISRVLFSLNKDKLKLSLGIISLGTEEIPAGATEFAGEVYDYIHLRPSDFTSLDLRSADLEFKVKKSWLAGKNLDLTDIGLFIYDKEWQSLPTQILVETEDYVYYTSATDSFGVFAIASGGNAFVRDLNSGEDFEKEASIETVSAAAVAEPDESPEEHFLKYYGEKEEVSSDTDWFKFFSMFVLILIAIVAVAVFAIRSFSNRGSRVEVNPGGEIKGGLTKEDFSEISDDYNFRSSESVGIYKEDDEPRELSEAEIKAKVQKMLAGQREEVEEELKERGYWKDEEEEDREIDVNRELGLESQKRRSNALERSKYEREARNRRMEDEERRRY